MSCRVHRCFAAHVGARRSTRRHSRHSSIALARIAEDHGDTLGGLDLNPVAVTADGKLVALDAALFRAEG